MKMCKWGNYEVIMVKLKAECKYTVKVYWGEACTKLTIVLANVLKGSAWPWHCKILNKHNQWQMVQGTNRLSIMQYHCVNCEVVLVFEICYAIAMLLHFEQSKICMFIFDRHFFSHQLWRVEVCLVYCRWCSAQQGGEDCLHDHRLSSVRDLLSPSGRSKLDNLILMTKKCITCTQ